jgi:hypothetical protein
METILAILDMVGVPLYFLRVKLGLIKVDEKYISIRPNDVFIYFKICGLWTLAILSTSITSYIIYGFLWGIGAFIGTTLLALLLIPLTGRLILDHILKQAEE